ncbi:TIM21 domain containing protein [Amanita muscaria]
MNTIWCPAAPARCTGHLWRLVQLNHSPSTRPRRRYAHRDTGPSGFSHSLDTQQPGASIPVRDTVGPFQLGISQDSLQQGKKVKKWSELGTGGKVLRTTERTTNLAVILLGAGLSALLVYSLTTEIFSKNSPTVLYNDACERIKSSSKIAKYMNGPLTFHNNPPTSSRPRHRNRHVTSQVMVDAYGNEHMILTFYIQGKPEGWAPLSSDMTYVERASEWTHSAYEKLSSLTLKESFDGTKEKTEQVLTSLKELFRYLSGMEKPLYPPALDRPSQQQEKRVSHGKEETGGRWGFAGIFSSLRGSKRTGGEVVKPRSQTFTEGEVHADLVRNEQGYFVFKYLLVDLPHTGHYNSIRVFVERTPGVRENEPVMRWSSSYS